MLVAVSTKVLGPAVAVYRAVAMPIRNTAKNQILLFNHAIKVAAIAVATNL